LTHVAKPTSLALSAHPARLSSKFIGADHTCDSP